MPDLITRSTSREMEIKTIDDNIDMELCVNGTK